MKIFFVIAAVVFCTAATDDYVNVDGWVDFRLVSKHGEKARTALPVECEKPGLVCGNCREAYLCNNATGEWEISLAKTCEGTETCNNGVCGHTPTPKCELEEKQFQCVSYEGMYPDPVSCTDFHYCIPKGGGLVLNSSSCGENSKFAYNPRTTYCDIVLSNRECESRIPICTKPAQTAALIENQSMYYICMPYESGSNVLYPFLHLCKNGRIYDGNYGCLPW